jgi:hypothetical protein
MNACDRAAQLLPEQWQHPLPAPDHAWLAQHLGDCAECAALDALWRGLEQIPAPEPSPTLWAGLTRRLAAQTQKSQTGRRLAWAAAAVLLLALGAGGGWWWRGPDLNPAPVSTAVQITSLRQEVEATRQLAVLALLRQASPSDRLQGVVASASVPASDGTMTAALLQVLKTDPSPDVRLAAIDALTRPGLNGSGWVVQAFPYQNSPLVQIAMIDRLASASSASGASSASSPSGAPARALLRTVGQSRVYLPEVRQRAAWALRQ